MISFANQLMKASIQKLTLLGECRALRPGEARERSVGIYTIELVKTQLRLFHQF